MSFRRILIAVDKGAIAAHALDVGLDLANALKAETALIHVATPPVAYGSGPGLPPSEFTDLAGEEGRKLLADLRERHRFPLTAHEFYEGGDPATEILKAASTWSADLIVVGSHGRGGVSRLVLGSVAEEVMRRARCPVLVVRPPN